ncbi:Eukaryotic aspartyl protease family protein [Raphanus sativus]|uniref:Probable aspartic proteinase GIP2 n=1 Tax=Raphanus sativus TaxID=3726 RepID=A0A9W3DU37_RAPSA|nr:probable aspartic proteinase GIP2 [Raphanus sativus]KAJ4895201.1 Eukaryotic aspartyl protease family protein [Raphanus sativus]
MASSSIIFSLLFLFFFSLSSAQPSFRPKALLLPVTKDKSTLQYTTVINQRTPHVAASVVFDLGGRNLWVDCDKDYVSTTYRSPRCNSAVCSRTGSTACGTCFSPPSPGCSNNTCSLMPDNSVTGTATSGEVATDVVSIQSTDGRNPGRAVKIPNLIFGCGATFLLEGLAPGTVGMAGMGRHNIGLPSQFAAAFSFNRKFAVCLTSGRGVAFFGNVPYILLPGILISRLKTTPLLINPVSTASAYSEGEKSTEYFIGVTDIKVLEKSISFNQTLLKIDATIGVGGTKISTVDPYTVMETSIFNGLTSAFVGAAALRNITRVSSVKPFGACFSSRNVYKTRVGYSVPDIQLVLQNNDIVWRILGANSMVTVSPDVICLGFVDGGVNARTSVVIGGLQLEDNLVEFDLASNRLGFSNTLLGLQTSCANFNFTSTSTTSTARYVL